VRWKVLEVLDGLHMLAVLGVLLQPRLEPVQSRHTKVEHVGVRGLSQRLKDKPEGKAKWNHGDQAVLNDPAKQLGGDMQLFVRVLREELVFLKQVLDHAVEDISFPWNPTCLELLEQLEDFVNANLVWRVIVDSLEVGICLILHLP